MDYLLWILISIFLVGFGIVLFLSGSRASRKVLESESQEFTQPNPDYPLVEFERISNVKDVSNTDLVSIDSPVVIASISELIPKGAELLVRTLTKTGAQKGDVLYRAILKPGQVMSKSRTMKDAVKGIAHGAKGISGHADLVAVNPSKAANYASGVANVMGLASMVVGQYYMTEINNKLEELGQGMQSISNLLNQEIDGAILAKIAAIGGISAFSSDILQVPAERNRQLQTLKVHKDEIAKLLGQANAGIKDLSEKADFKIGSKGVERYEAAVQSLEKLMQRQQILVALFSQACDLEFALGLGEISLEQSRYEFVKFEIFSNQIRTQLASWHSRQMMNLQIDFDHGRAQKGPVAALAGHLKEDWKYFSINSSIQSQIESQQGASVTRAIAPSVAFEEDVEIVVKDGQYWYRKPSTLDS